MSLHHACESHSLPLRFNSGLNLFEDLPVCPFVGLPLHGDWLIPAPHVFNKLFVLLFLGIKLCELIALVIGSYVESRGCFLTADDKGAFNNGVITFAINRGGAENVFTGSFETSEEATCGG